MQSAAEKKLVHACANVAATMVVVVVVVVVVAVAVAAVVVVVTMVAVAAAVATAKGVSDGLRASNSKEPLQAR